MAEGSALKVLGKTDSRRHHVKQVLIYTKTSCPYSRRAKELLTQKGATFDEVDIEQAPERRKEMIEASNGRTTTPEIFIGGEWVGGMEDLARLEQQGTLDQILKEGETSQPGA